MGRKLAAAFVASACVAGAGAGATGAAGPIREPGQPTSGVAPAGAVCSFALDVETIENGVTVKTYLDPDGNITRIKSEGRLVIRLTNLDSGASIDVNASGPGTLTINLDGSLDAVGGGLGLLLLTPGDAGGPGAFLSSGRIHLVIGPTGITTFESTGLVRDLCAELS